MITVIPLFTRYSYLKYSPYSSRETANIMLLLTPYLAHYQPTTTFFPTLSYYFTNTPHELS